MHASNYQQPLFNDAFRDGRIPKNKDANGFAQDVQTADRAEKFLRDKREKEDHHNGYTLAKSLPEGHIFGVKQTNMLDMLGVMQNRYITQ